MLMYRILARDLQKPVYAIVGVTLLLDNQLLWLNTDQDLRNHGDSPHDPAHNYAVMASDVEEFIQVHGLKTPVVIGHSMSVCARFSNITFN